MQEPKRRRLRKQRRKRGVQTEMITAGSKENDERRKGGGWLWPHKASPVAVTAEFSEQRLFHSKSHQRCKIIIIIIKFLKMLNK